MCLTFAQWRRQERCCSMFYPRCLSQLSRSRSLHKPWVCSSTRTHSCERTDAPGSIQAHTLMHIHIRTLTHSHLLFLYKAIYLVTDATFTNDYFFFLTWGLHKWRRILQKLLGFRRCSINFLCHPKNKKLFKYFF